MVRQAAETTTTSANRPPLRCHLGCWKMLETAWKTRGKLIESIHRQIIRCSFVQFIVIYNYNLTPIVENLRVAAAIIIEVPDTRPLPNIDQFSTSHFQWKTDIHRQLFRDNSVCLLENHDFSTTMPGKCFFASICLFSF